VQEVQWVVLTAEASGEEPSAALALAAALVLGFVHVFAGRLNFLDRIPRSRWLSAAGGVSVAYVFVHVLPELEAGGAAIEGSELPVLTFFERHVYLVALVGFVTFYGLERLARERETNGRGSDNGVDGPDEHGEGSEPSEDRSPDNEGSSDNESSEGSGTSGVFWIHVGSFAIYNGLIGRLLLHQDDPVTLLTYTIAIGLHFVVNDYGLREIHGDLYHRVGRWLLAGAVLVGAAIGVVTEIGEALFATVFALVAGGIVLNVIKEELPEERASRFWAFGLGVVGYTVLLLAV